MARASDLDRRGFLAAAAGAAAWLLAPGRARAADPPPEALPLLEKSEFVYVSPLFADGRESTCHGEVWYGWLDGAILINTRRGTWKTRALRDRGLDRARVWVGDHGRWKTGLIGSGRNESFREAPHFDTRASFETDRAVLDRLLAQYEDKYAGEFGRWREDMRTGVYSGQRVLIRYEPI
ncbi:MAG TPA: hypothetical protein VLC53_18115 [Myxococcota bacterium]|nr:hypothetical protein [Myxococcota bacterium]